MDIVRKKRPFLPCFCNLAGVSAIQVDISSPAEKKCFLALTASDVFHQMLSVQMKKCCFHAASCMLPDSLHCYMQLHCTLAEAGTALFPSSLRKLHGLISIGVSIRVAQLCSSLEIVPPLSVSLQHFV